MSTTLNLSLIFVMLQVAVASAPKEEVLFLISCQDNSYHMQLGTSLRNDIIKQTHAISTDYIINIRFLHEIFNHPGDWNILTALPQLTVGSKRIVNDNIKWIILCEESTHVELATLLERLTQENHTQAFYLGHALYDREATIIHHFAFFENPTWFPYPMLRAGVIFTPALLKRVAALLAATETGNGNNYSDNSKPKRHTDFTIDAAHELARFIFDNVRVASDSRQRAPVASGALLAAAEGQAQHSPNVQKMILRSAPYICPRAPKAPHKSRHVTEHQACALYAQPANMSTCRPVKREQIYFAIKTCYRFHKERIPIMEATWAPYAVHKRYFSDVADADIPTNNTGVRNVETGHCAKTLAILKLAFKDIEQMKRRHLNQNSIHWILLTDDDTLLSVAGICEILGCFNPLQPMYLGERYGYRLHADDGFNYITGGGGIALSLPTVELIIRHCTCPSPTAPDDMILGSCLHSLQVKAVHSARFHQARPNDYPSALLEIEPPATFHKFWQSDPLATYEHWFATSDRRLLQSQQLSHAPKLDAVKPVSDNCENSKFSIAACKKEAAVRQFNSVESVADPHDITLAQYASLHHAKDKHLDL